MKINWSKIWKQNKKFCNEKGYYPPDKILKDKIQELVEIQLKPKRNRSKDQS